MDVALQRGVPSSVDTETILLGAVLHNNETLAAVSGIMQPEIFFDSRNGIIYRRMQELYDRSIPIDRVTLANHLASHGELEKCGGLAAIAHLDEKLPEIANPTAYARILRELSALRRVALTASKLQIKALDPSASASELIQESVNSLLGVDRDLAATETIQRVNQIIAELPGGISGLITQSPATAGIPTGFRDIDDLTMGLPRECLTILAARPSAGKSAMMGNIAVHVASEGDTPVAIFSMEMSKRNLIERMMCSVAEVSLLRLRNGNLDQDDISRLERAARWIEDLPIYIDESTALDPGEIASKLDRLVRSHGVKLCFIDYLQQMSLAKRRGGREKNPNEQMTEITKSLKSTARRQSVAVCALSQLSRAPDKRAGDHRPMLSDLRDSGSIEQDADMVMFLWREYQYRRDKESLKDQAECIIAKQRNGPTETVKLRWRAAITKFENE